MPRPTSSTSLAPLALLVLAACQDAATAPRPSSGARAAAAATEPVARWTMTRVFPEGFAETSFGWDINDAGQVVANLSTGGYRVTLGDPANATPFGMYSFATAINASGDVVGERGPGYRPYRWPAGGGEVNLAAQAGGTVGRVWDINDRGQAVGFVAGLGAVVWEPDGSVTVIGLLPGLGLASAHAINASGTVVGTASGIYGGRRAFVWTPEGGIRPLAGTSDSEAFGINDAGVVVGRMLVGGFYQAVVWPTPDRYELLEHGNYPYAVALGIDNTGMITGSTQSDGAALVWRTAASRPENVARLACEGGGAPADLCLPGAPGFEYRGLARGANARGQIAGTAFVGVGPSGAGTPVAVVFSLAPTSAAGTLLADRNSGRCLDVLGESRDRGTPLAIYDCHGRANQRFTYPAVGETGEIRVYGAEGGALCLDAQGGSDADGTPVLTWSCHGGANQRWTRTAAGEFRGIGGKCLDVVGAGTANLTGVWLWTCYGGANQRWDTRAAAQIAAR